jgi:hypothetical protein
MKLTDDILLDIGFTYSTSREEFTLFIPNVPTLTIFNIGGKYSAYINFQHPGIEINNVIDIISLVSKWSVRYGREEKTNEIKSALGL